MEEERFYFLLVPFIYHFEYFFSAQRSFLVGLGEHMWFKG